MDKSTSELTSSKQNTSAPAINLPKGGGAVRGIGEKFTANLMIGVKNNLGAETKVHHAPSTKFYLNDKQDGKLWVTRLPFPVHVVERVVTYDHSSRNRFATHYTYHHGYFDGIEHKFRGSGMIEQRDTEEIGNAVSGIIAAKDTNWDSASFVPPVHRRVLSIPAYRNHRFSAATLMTAGPQR